MDRVYSLTDTAAALEHVRHGEQFGKMVAQGCNCAAAWLPARQKTGECEYKRAAPALPRKRREHQQSP